MPIVCSAPLLGTVISPLIWIRVLIVAEGAYAIRVHFLRFTVLLFGDYRCCSAFPTVRFVLQMLFCSWSCCGYLRCRHYLFRCSTCYCVRTPGISWVYMPGDFRCWFHSFTHLPACTLYTTILPLIVPDSYLIPYDLFVLILRTIVLFWVLRWFPSVLELRSTIPGYPAWVICSTTESVTVEFWVRRLFVAGGSSIFLMIPLPVPDSFELWCPTTYVVVIILAISLRWVRCWNCLVHWLRYSVLLLIRAMISHWWFGVLFWRLQCVLCWNVICSTTGMPVPIGAVPVLVFLPLNFIAVMLVMNAWCYLRWCCCYGADHFVTRVCWSLFCRSATVACVDCWCGGTHSPFTRAAAGDSGYYLRLSAVCCICVTGHCYDGSTILCNWVTIAVIWCYLVCLTFLLFCRWRIRYAVPRRCVGTVTAFVRWWPIVLTFWTITRCCSVVVVLVDAWCASRCSATDALFTFLIPGLVLFAVLSLLVMIHSITPLVRCSWVVESPCRLPTVIVVLIVTTIRSSVTAITLLENSMQRCRYRWYRWAVLDCSICWWWFCAIWRLNYFLLPLIVPLCRYPITVAGGVTFWENYLVWLTLICSFDGGLRCSVFCCWCQRLFILTDDSRSGRVAVHTTIWLSLCWWTCWCIHSLGPFVDLQLRCSLPHWLWYRCLTCSIRRWCWWWMTRSPDCWFNYCSLQPILLITLLLLLLLLYSPTLLWWLIGVRTGDLYLCWLWWGVISHWFVTITGVAITIYVRAICCRPVIWCLGRKVFRYVLPSRIRSDGIQCLSRGDTFDLGDTIDDAICWLLIATTPWFLFCYCTLLFLPTIVFCWFVLILVVFPRIVVTTFIVWFVLILLLCYSSTCLMIILLNYYLYYIVGCWCLFLVGSSVCPHSTFFCVWRWYILITFIVDSDLNSWCWNSYDLPFFSVLQAILLRYFRYNYVILRTDYDGDRRCCLEYWPWGGGSGRPWCSGDGVVVHSRWEGVLLITPGKILLLICSAICPLLQLLQYVCSRILLLLLRPTCLTYHYAFGVMNYLITDSISSWPYSLFCLCGRIGWVPLFYLLFIRSVDDSCSVLLCDLSYHQIHCCLRAVDYLHLPCLPITFAVISFVVIDCSALLLNSSTLAILLLWLFALPIPAWVLLLFVVPFLPLLIVTDFILVIFYIVPVVPLIWRYWPGDILELLLLSCSPLVVFTGCCYSLHWNSTLMLEYCVVLYSVVVIGLIPRKFIITNYIMIPSLCDAIPWYILVSVVLWLFERILLLYLLIVTWWLWNTLCVVLRELLLCYCDWLCLLLSLFIKFVLIYGCYGTVDLLLIPLCCCYYSSWWWEAGVDTITQFSVFGIVRYCSVLLIWLTVFIVVTCCSILICCC